MPIHDWTRVGAGIFHAFHHEWISKLAHALNDGLLPDDYYALPEQYAGRFGPDVLTLQETAGDGDGGETPRRSAGTAMLIAPNLAPTAETDMAFYRRKQKVVAVRHASGDRVVAMIEIVSPNNKAARSALRAFVEKAAGLLEAGIHLLIVDLHPPSRRDPAGIHAEIWQEIAGQEYTLPSDKPFILASYEVAESVRAYVEHAAAVETLRDMPLFIEPGRAVMVPLEASYNAAFAELPRRWRSVLDAVL